MSLILSILFIALAYLLGAVPSASPLPTERHGYSHRRQRKHRGHECVSVGQQAAGHRDVCLRLSERLRAGVRFSNPWKMVTGNFQGSEIGILCGVAAIVGHNWPVYLKFKGGKGIATSAGFCWALLRRPSASAFSAGSFFLSPAASSRSPPSARRSSCRWSRGRCTPAKGFCSPIVLTILGLLAVWRHKSNIQRLIGGTEHRFSFKKIKFQHEDC